MKTSITLRVSNKINLKIYHHGENDCSSRSFDYPQQDEAGQLDHSEHVHLPQGNVAEVDQVRLVLGRHSKQFDAVKKLHM